MKNKCLILTTLLLASTATYAEQSIVISPGSAITVFPSMATTVMCSGSGVQQQPTVHCGCRENSNSSNTEYQIVREGVSLTEYNYQTRTQCNLAIGRDFSSLCIY